MMIRKEKIIFVVVILVFLIMGFYHFRNTITIKKDLCGLVLYKNVGKPYSNLYQFTNGNQINLSSSYPLLDSLNQFVQSPTNNHFIYGSISHSASEASINLIDLENQIRKELGFLKNGGILDISVSRNDSIVAIITSHLGNEISHLFREKSIILIDIHTKQIVYSMEKVAGATLVSMNEFAWNHNNEFVFSVASKMDPLALEKDEYLSPGIYKFSLLGKKINKIHNLFGSNVQYNMNGDHIAFNTPTTVYIFNNTQEKPKAILELGSRYNINSLRWSPCDTEILLVVFWDKRKKRTNQYFINTSTGEKEEVNFNCFVEKTYSWIKDIPIEN